MTGATTGTDADASTTQAYQTLRPLMFSIAYRMLGTVSEAEDIVQEAFLRYHQAVAARGEPATPKAYLSTVVTRLAIDQLRSARGRRESYIGDWLPEPVVTGHAGDFPATLPPDPADAAEQSDSLSMAFLLLIERLTPLERAVFLLHDVFGYSYEETASVVGRRPAATRQLAHRAREHVEARRPRFPAAGRERDELASKFFAAVSEGDMTGLVSLLAADVEVHGDSGGVPPSWRKPIVGSAHVARLMSALGNQLRHAGARLQVAEINGQPGALALGPDDRLIAVLVLDIVDSQVTTIRSVISRPKLGHLGPLADLSALLQAQRQA